MCFCSGHHFINAVLYIIVVPPLAILELLERHRFCSSEILSLPNVGFFVDM